MSRRETMAEPAWRALVFRVDGTVRSEKYSVRTWFETVALEPGERALYQVRSAGKSRFNTCVFRKHENAT